MTDVEQLVDAVVPELLARYPDVDDAREDRRRRFGAGSLRVGGKIFGMVRDGGLVVRLPPERVAALLAVGGRPFGSGGRVMRGWVVVEPHDEATCLARLDEAYAHVRAQVDG